MVIGRITSGQASPDRVDEFVEWWQDALNGLKGQVSGLQSAYLLVDRESGTGKGVALWESREALDSAMPQVDQVLQQGGQYLSGPPQVEEFEVAAQV
jgi:hypothetical protein